MKELALKYGCNPNQKPSRIFMTEGELPIEVINGRPGYINFLDAPGTGRESYRMCLCPCTWCRPHVELW